MYVVGHEMAVLATDSHKSVNSGSSHTAGCCCARPVSATLGAGAKGTGAIGTAPTAGAFAFFGGPGFLLGSPGCLFLFLAAPVPSAPASDPAYEPSGSGEPVSPAFAAAIDAASAFLSIGGGLGCDSI